MNDEPISRTPGSHPRATEGGYLFTSESVSKGHPNKLSNRISDAILDRFLGMDPTAKVACETFVCDRLVVVAGEFATDPPGLFAALESEIPDLVRQVIRDTGYRSSDFPGIDPDACEIRLQLNRQTDDIGRRVEQGGDVLGAGDQGLVFGYATDEIHGLVPLPLLLAHRLVARQVELRRSGELPWLRPDAKRQVSVRCRDERPEAVETVVLPTQHAEAIPIATVHRLVVECILDPLEPKSLHGPGFRLLVNPTGRFVIGGPQGDTGLTGRKIIVDTDDGRCPRGGGAFSGKDPAKVDRSAAYMARYIAKNVVAPGLARRCTLQLAYAIGVAEPVSLHLDLHGTGTVTNERLAAAIPQVFDLTPAGIVRALDLRRPVYRQTAAYGHFGRELPDFSRERTGRAEKLRRLVETFDLADQRRLSRFMQELNSGGELSEEARRWWINRY